MSVAREEASERALTAQNNKTTTRDVLDDFLENETVYCWPARDDLRPDSLLLEPYRNAISEAFCADKDYTKAIRLHTNLESDSLEIWTSFKLIWPHGLPKEAVPHTQYSTIDFVDISDIGCGIKLRIEQIPAGTEASEFHLESTKRNIIKFSLFLGELYLKDSIRLPISTVYVLVFKPEALADRLVNSVDLVIFLPFQSIPDPEDMAVAFRNFILECNKHLGEYLSL